MAHLSVIGNHLVLTLTTFEKVAALHGDLRVPTGAVTSVEVVQQPFAYVRGFRAPGLAIPGRLLIGTWRCRAGRMFVVARRGVPAVRVRLAGWRYDELLVSDPGAAAMSQRLRSTLDPAESVFTERDIAITGGGLRLSGTITVPAGQGPFPGVLILPGSGDLDRDADHRRIPLGISRALADHLAAVGFASLRYDKRGAGRSKGVFLEAGMTENRLDAAAAWVEMGRAPEVRADSMFLLGHSEGALHAMALAAQARPMPAGLVLLSPAAKTGEQTLAWQTRQIAASLPRPLRRLLRVLHVDVVEKQRQAVAAIRATSTDVARIQGRRINARWTRELLDFDPRTSLSALRMPVLAVTGTKDLQVDPADLDTIGDVVPGPVDVVAVPDLTHLLRRDPKAASLSAYRRLIRQPVDADTLDLITHWIARHSSGHPGTS